jgi:hypothetical protein
MLIYIKTLAFRYYRNRRNCIFRTFYDLFKKLKLNAILILFRLTVAPSFTYTPQTRKRIAA